MPKRKTQPRQQCDCGACAVCAHREYMRKKRAEERFLSEIVWPSAPSWADQARAEAEKLLTYLCPLTAAVEREAGIIKRSQELCKAAGMSVLTAEELLNGEADNG